MNSFSGFLERMGSNFLVAAIIPSFTFVTSCLIVFWPLIPNTLREILFGDKNILGDAALISLLLSVIIGFTLTSLNTFILKMFEGYILFWRIPFLKRNEKRRAYIMRLKLKKIRQKIQKLETSDSPRSRQIKKLLESKEFDLATTLQSEFPLYDAEILPTRFGNTLKGAESYPRIRYGIDAVPMWQRLIKVIPEDYYKKIDQSLDQLSFLVNCGVLSAFFSIATLFTFMYQFLWFCFSVNQNTSIGTQSILVYMLSSLTGGFLSVVFYRAARVSVSQYGEFIRSAYDLFRFDLLREMHMPLPKDWIEERDEWEKICEFMSFGFTKEPLEPIPYVHTNTGS